MASTPPPSTNSCTAHATASFHHPKTRYRTAAHAAAHIPPEKSPPPSRPSNVQSTAGQCCRIPRCAPPTIQKLPAHSTSRAALPPPGENPRIVSTISTSKPSSRASDEKKKGIATAPRPIFPLKIFCTLTAFQLIKSIAEVRLARTPRFVMLNPIGVNLLILILFPADSPRVRT